MNNLRKIELIMLDAKEKESFSIGLQFNGVLKNCSSLRELGIGKPQHLYFFSDDEIKDGDWMINTNGDTLLKYDSKNEGDGTWREFWRKIIATTDKLLIKHNYTDVHRLEDIETYVPQPSQSFIEKYIEEYNKGNIITDVLVEYKGYKINGMIDESTSYRPKVNPQDNTITIKKVKDSWSCWFIKKL
jgi:hypothetical protein